MPQGPIAVAGTNLIPQGAKNSKNISASAVLKAAPGTLLAVSVVTPGTAPGSFNDTTTVAGATSANQIATIPDSAGIGVYPMVFPFTSGLVVLPGAGQVLAVAFI